MANAATANDFRVVSRERLLGTEQRWRRFGEPTPAGYSRGEDGEIDYGLFGPGSVAWEVLLHPVQMFFETLAQGILQFTYKPIFAGVRDVDPITRNALAGKGTIFDAMDRGQRNSGIHAPMWFGDTATAKRVAKHLVNIHRKVQGDVIDVGQPELGGYEANTPRESMWAALTEAHAMLWVYERLGHGTSRLNAAQRDQYVKEMAEYVRLFPHDEQVPENMADLRARYARDAELFAYSESVQVMPATGEPYQHYLMGEFKKNFHPSQLKVFREIVVQQMFNLPVAGALSGVTRANMGMSPAKSRAAVAARVALRPVILLMQSPPVARKYMRLMWGPDAMRLIRSARILHEAAKGAGRGSFVALAE